MKSPLSLLFIVLLIFSCSSDDKPIEYELTTSISPTEGGSVSSSSGTFDSGESLELTAVPADGYVFSNWSGAISSTENPISITFDEDKSLTAIFEKLDTDQDGVADDEDQCSDTASGVAVDADGCSLDQKDSDGDGIVDAQDQCPDSAAGAEVTDTGCISEDNDAGGETVEDSDGDGVEDDIDQCSETPDGEVVDAQGCSESQSDGEEDEDEEDEDEEEDQDEEEDDSDGDGVNDDIDECPDTPEDEDVDEQGCSVSQIDSDGDGVNDDIDECPNTPENEEVNEQGCADSQIDGDGDGVFRDLDICPGTPSDEEADEQGCSASQRDSDNDGINDAMDECPDTAEDEDVDETGCPISLTTFVPDDTFEQSLIDAGLDDNMDDFVLTANISGVLSLEIIGGFDRVDGLDLTGLEDFVSLENLTIGFIDNLVLDLISYPSLERLEIFEVGMNILEVGSGSNLEDLIFDELVSVDALNVINNNSLINLRFANDNNVEVMVISGNTSLETISDFDGRFENVTIANNSSLRELSFGETDNVNSLELGNNPALETFNLNLVQDEGYPLDFSTCPNLKTIDFGFRGGAYGSIDISQNPLLERLIARDCELTNLDVSNNPLLSELDVEINSSLNCIRVSEAQLADIPSEWSKDATANYATDCP